MNRCTIMLLEITRTSVSRRRRNRPAIGASSAKRVSRHAFYWSHRTITFRVFCPLDFITVAVYTIFSMIATTSETARPHYPLTSSRSSVQHD
jgi:hypothetical protein